VLQIEAERRQRLVTIASLGNPPAYKRNQSSDIKTLTFDSSVYPAETYTGEELADLGVLRC
jgi:hypothetical protein